MLIGMNPKSVRTQPLAPGAENELSTSFPLLKVENADCSSKETSELYRKSVCWAGADWSCPSRLSSIGLGLDPT